MEGDEIPVEELSVSDRLNQSMGTLPVSIAELVPVAKENADAFLTDNILNRIIAILLNEQDERISNKQTKVQCIQVLHYIARFSMKTRSYLRLILRPIEVWFDIDMSNEDGPVNDPELLRKIKTVFAACWKIHRRMAKALINNVQETVEDAKVIFIRQYAATQFQAIIRGFVSRLKLKRYLAAQAAAQKEELIQWSCINIQRVARSYIARKTTIRSMRIRKTLSHEVVHIAERYLKGGDVWGFLKEINEELVRVNNVVLENESREFNWATNFVEKVIAKRQDEFADAWERFPAALAEFKRDKATEEGTLLDKNTMGTAGGGAKGAAAAAPSGHTHKSPGKTAARTSKSASAASAGSTQLASTSRTVKSDKTLITPADVAAANSKAFRNLPGPMVRKAVTKTVQVEVAHELNRLVNGEFRSKQLAQNIRDAYGNDCDPTARPVGGAAPSGARTHRSGATVTGSTGSPSKPTPAGFVPPPKKKKRFDINGKLIPDVGKVGATHEVDWLSDALEEAEAAAVPTDPSRPTSADQIKVVQQPGNNLLLDVPRGVQDSIERLLHAAALRCFVPDFFRGVEPLPAEGPVNDWAEDGEEAILGRQKGKKVEVNINSNASYAYQVYLQMPRGLAKMRYEVECKKFSQGAINKLRLKGLHYLPDIAPVSKMIMCLKSVDTPRVLLNTAVDMYIELREMGSAALGLVHQETVDQFNRIEPITMPRTGSPKRRRSPHRASLSAALTDIPDSAAPSEAGDASRPTTASSAKSSDSRPGSRHRKKKQTTFVDGEGHVQKAPQVQARVVFDELTKEQRTSKLPGQMLVNMVEENGEWCDLKAAVEDLFLHAAFLVVPHKRVTRKVSGDLVESVTEMGNLAFKEHSRDLLRMTSEEDKREAVKERFQAAFILTTPFCLYLKSKRIYIVEDLLSIDLADLRMPRPLETQLEALLTAVVAKCSNSKLVPVPRNLLSTAKRLFQVPMLYDPKFQRSPFDPYGRPPRLQKGGVKVLKKLKEADEVEVVEAQALVDMNRVAGAKQVSMHLEEPITLWTQKVNAAGGGGSSLTMGTSEWMESIQEQQHEGEEESADLASQDLAGAELLEGSMDSKWTFHIDARLLQGEAHEEASLAASEEQRGGLLAPVQPSARSKKSSGRNHPKKKARPSAPHITPADLRTAAQQNQDFRLTDIVNDAVFQHSYVCHHPNCKQVFSRLYTYKIHLKSHETFSAYHDYKRQPQLFLDADSTEVAEKAAARHVESYSLPPVITRTFKNMTI